MPGEAEATSQRMDATRRLGCILDKMGIPSNDGMVNPGVVVALTAATANLLMAALHFAIARAPGWRIARLFAGMAFTAGLYNILNAVYCIAGMSDTVYLAAG